MSKYHFCLDCEHIKTRMVPGRQGTTVEESSCPARFNPMEGKWIPTDGTNPHLCPRNENYMNLLKQGDERRLR
jgi:hypothetical protein